MRARMTQIQENIRERGFWVVGAAWLAKSNKIPTAHVPREASENDQDPDILLCTRMPYLGHARA